MSKQLKYRHFVFNTEVLSLSLEQLLDEQKVDHRAVSLLIQSMWNVYNYLDLCSEEHGTINVEVSKLTLMKSELYDEIQMLRNFGSDEIPNPF